MWIQSQVHVVDVTYSQTVTSEVKMDGAPGDRLYYLVFWQDQTYDIVEDYRVKYNDDGTQLVEWHGKYYPALILRESRKL